MDKVQVNLKDFQIIPDINSVRKEEIDDETYFSPAYSQYVSNSRLKFIDPKSDGDPQKFKSPPKISTGSLLIGSTVHECLLQPESFELGPKIGKPSEKLGLVMDYIPKFLEEGIGLDDAIKAAAKKAEYYVSCIDSKVSKIKEAWETYSSNVKNLSETSKVRRIISDKNWDVVNGCLKSCYDNERIMSLLHPINSFGEQVESSCEDAFFMDYIIIYKDTNCARIKFKMKADNITIDPESKVLTLNDLKTTGHNVNSFMEPGGSWDHFDYARQMACYSQVLKYYFMKNRGISRQTGWTLKANMLVVETIPHFWSRAYYVTDNQLRSGLSSFYELMYRVGYCEMFGYDKEIEFV